MLVQSIEESRSLTAELSPPILYEAGLEAGLDWLGRWMLEKHGLKAEVQADGPLKDISEDLRAFLFRAVRELLFNVVKHAKVDRARVEATADSKQVRIIVRDNGQGYDASAVKKERNESGGFGLFSIRERLTYMGGRMNIHTALAKAPGSCWKFHYGERRKSRKCGSLRETYALRP